MPRQSRPSLQVPAGSEDSGQAAPEQPAPKARKRRGQASGTVLAKAAGGLSLATGSSAVSTSLSTLRRRADFGTSRAFYPIQPRALSRGALVLASLPEVASVALALPGPGGMSGSISVIFVAGQLYAGIQCWQAGSQAIAAVGHAGQELLATATDNVGRISDRMTESVLGGITTLEYVGLLCVCMLVAGVVGHLAFPPTKTSKIRWGWAHK